MTVNRKIITPWILSRQRSYGSARLLAVVIGKCVFFGLLVASLVNWQAYAIDDAAPLFNPNSMLSTDQFIAAASLSKSESHSENHQKRANIGQESMSRNARNVADWVVVSGDNHGMPFVIIDKINAKVFVFNADGQLSGSSPALLGLALGDDPVPGIGGRKLSSIRPEERTTPAGRFVASLARNLHGGKILWVDYDLAISLHPVITTNLKEQRAQRLATPTPQDNRISFGCINVPAIFFERVVSAAFSGTSGIVYVLPEIRTLKQVFGLDDTNHPD